MAGLKKHLIKLVTLVSLAAFLVSGCAEGDGYASAPTQQALNVTVAAAGQNPTPNPNPNDQAAQAAAAASVISNSDLEAKIPKLTVVGGDGAEFSCYAPVDINQLMQEVKGFNMCRVANDGTGAAAWYSTQKRAYLQWANQNGYGDLVQQLLAVKGNNVHHYPGTGELCVGEGHGDNFNAFHPENSGGQAQFEAFCKDPKCYQVDDNKNGRIVQAFGQGDCTPEKIKQRAQKTVPAQQRTRIQVASPDTVQEGKWLEDMLRNPQVQGIPALNATYIAEANLMVIYDNGTLSYMDSEGMITPISNTAIGMDGEVYFAMALMKDNVMNLHLAWTTPVYPLVLQTDGGGIVALGAAWYDVGYRGHVNNDAVAALQAVGVKQYIIDGAISGKIPNGYNLGQNIFVPGINPIMPGQIEIPSFEVIDGWLPAIPVFP